MLAFFCLSFLISSCRSCLTLSSPPFYAVRPCLLSCCLPLSLLLSPLSVSLVNWSHVQTITWIIYSNYGETTLQHRSHAISPHISNSIVPFLMRCASY